MSQHSFQATPLAPDLTFINVTNSKSLSKKSKEVVRGHVTRRVFQERRYRKQGHEVANVSRARASITCDDDHEEGEETEKSTTGNGSAKAITFKAYRPPKKPSLSVLQPSPTLLERLITIYGPSPSNPNTPNGIDHMWFLFLDEDPLLCQATLGYSSAAHGRRLPLTDTTPAVRHKMDAIRMINERLPDVKKATSVGTMIGVAVLANVERLTGNLAAWKMHLTGLQQIVALRERLYGATPQDWMSKGLSWAFLSASLLCSNPEQIRNDTCSSKPPFQHCAVMAPSNTVDSSVIVMVLEQGGYHDLIPIVTAIRAATFSHSEVQISSMPHGITQSYLDDLTQFQKSPRPSILEERLLDSFCTGLAIYIVTTFPSLDITSRTANLATELHSILDAKETQFCSGIELLLWEVFLGAVAAKIGAMLDLRIYFAEKVWAVSNTLGLSSWKEAERILDGIFWLNESLRAECKEVWRMAWHDDTRIALPEEEASFAMCRYGI